METPSQPRLIDAPIKEEIKIPPIAIIKAKILAFREGITYREAVQKLLGGEIEENLQERRENHAP